MLSKVFFFIFLELLFFMNFLRFPILIHRVQFYAYFVYFNNQSFIEMARFIFFFFVPSRKENSVFYLICNVNRSFEMTHFISQFINRTAFAALMIISNERFHNRFVIYFFLVFCSLQRFFGVSFRFPLFCSVAVWFVYFAMYYYCCFFFLRSLKSANRAHARRNR